MRENFRKFFQGLPRSDRELMQILSILAYHFKWNKKDVFQLLPSELEHLLNTLKESELI